MRAGFRSARSLTAATLILLCGCKPGAGGSQDLVSQVLFTATGAFDAQADLRERIPVGQRRTTWERRPPLDAQQIVVVYDSDARPLSWMLDLRSPGFTAHDVAGAGARTVTTPKGQGLRPGASSKLADTLILPNAQGLRILTRGYVTQNEPELLAAFQR